MLIYLVSLLGLMGSPYFAAFLIAVLGFFIGKYLKFQLVTLISIVTLGASLFLLLTMREMEVLIALSDLFFSIILSASIWITALVTSRDNPSFKNLLEKIKTSTLR